MTVALITVGVVAWYLAGVSGFIYWWTSDFDLTGGDLFGGCVAGLIFGPFAWLIGRSVHRKPTAPRVFLKRRT